MSLFNKLCGINRSAVAMMATMAAVDRNRGTKTTHLKISQVPGNSQ